MMSSRCLEAASSDGEATGFPKTLWSSKKSDYGTPLYLYQALDSNFHFTLDPCTTPDNPLGAPKYYTVEDDGLAQSWAGERAFINPPYSRRRAEPAAWVRKAYMEALDNKALCVLLLAARTDTSWFHDYCSHGLIGFIRGRLRFRGARGSAPFPSMIVVFGEDYWRRCPYRVMPFLWYSKFRQPIDDGETVIVGCNIDGKTDWREDENRV